MSGCGRGGGVNFLESFGDIRSTCSSASYEVWSSDTLRMNKLK